MTTTLSKPFLVELRPRAALDGPVQVVRVDARTAAQARQYAIRTYPDSVVIQVLPENPRVLPRRRSHVRTK